LGNSVVLHILTKVLCSSLQKGMKTYGDGELPHVVIPSLPSDLLRLGLEPSDELDGPPDQVPSDDAVKHVHLPPDLSRPERQRPPAHMVARRRDNPGFLVGRERVRERFPSLLGRGVDRVRGGWGRRHEGASAERRVMVGRLRRRGPVGSSGGGGRGRSQVEETVGRGRGGEGGDGEAAGVGSALVG
jgi:hypothetical protein